MPAPEGTTAINVGWGTNIPATCTFGGNTANDSGTSHYVTLSPLSDGFDESYTIVCQDVTNPANTVEAGPVTVEVGMGCPVIPATAYCQSSSCTTNCTPLSLTTSASMFHPADGSAAPFYPGDSVDVGGSGYSPIGATAVSVSACPAGQSSCYLTIPAGSSFSFSVTASTWDYAQTNTYTYPITSPVAVSASANPSSLTPPQNTATLTATASGGVGPYTYAWTQISGPAGVTFSNSSSGQTTVTVSQWGQTYSFQVTATDSNNHTATANVSIQSPPTQAASVTTGAPSANSIWWADAATGQGQVDISLTVSSILAGWQVTGMSYSLGACQTGTQNLSGACSSGNMTSVSGESGAFNQAIYLGPGSYQACVTALSTDGTNCIMDSVSIGPFYVYLQPSASITSPSTVWSSTGPVVATVTGSYGSSYAPFQGQTISAVAVSADGQPMGNAAGTSGTFSFFLSTGNHVLNGFAQDGTTEPDGTQTGYWSPPSAGVGVLVVPTFSPSVAITSPTFGVHVLAGTPVTIQAQASAAPAPGWTIQNVKINCDTGNPPTIVLFSQPYQATWNNLPAGVYSFDAVATDNEQNSSQSNWVTVNVDSPPVVSITNPASDSVYPIGSTVAVAMTAFDPNPGGSVAEVDLYVDSGVYVGSATWVGNSSYTYVWATGSAPGTHQLHAFATDAYGWTSWSATVFVLVSSAGSVVPYFSQQPANAAVVAGQSAVFQVGAVGVPAPTYQWQLNSGSGFINIAGATGSTYITVPLALTSSGWQYQCVASNAVGSLTSEPATLTVNPPSPLTATGPGYQTVAVGQQATFQITVSGGVPPYSYQWDSAPPGSTTWAPVAGATAPVYNVTPASLSANGAQYRCQVTDSQPGAPTTIFSSTGVLDVPSLTLVDSPLNPYVIMQGQTAGFLVTVAWGVPPYQYEWQRSTAPNGMSFVDIPGAANSGFYSFVATDATYNEYVFRCIVTDASGASVISAPSTFGVIIPQGPDEAQLIAFLPIPTLSMGDNNFGGMVTYRNVGYNAWTSTGGYQLGSQDPAGNTTWGFSTLSLDPGEVIPPGSTRSFNLPIMAPDANGVFGCFWQMEHNGNWFGDVAGQSVTVGTGNSPLTLNNVPSVLSVSGEIDLPSDSAIQSITYSFTSGGENSSVTAAAAMAGSSTATPVASVTLPSGEALDLASLRLSPGNYVLWVTATYTWGLQSTPLQKSITLVDADLGGIRVYPNPWRSNVHEGHPITFDQLSGGTTIKIFTVSGRSVITLPASNNSVTWDLKNDSGELVQSGLYLFVATDDQGNKVRGKFSIIR